MVIRENQPLNPTKLRAARKAANLTQTQLAERVGQGWTKYTVSNLERGYEVDVSLDALTALAEALNTSLQNLTGSALASGTPGLTLDPDRLRTARKALGLTQQELAVKAGFKQSGLSKLETGDTGISLEGVQALAEALGVSVKYLVGGFEENLESGDPLERIRSRPDIPAGLRELATARTLIEELQIEPEEWRALAGLAASWRDAHLIRRDGWAQILLSLRLARPGSEVRAHE
jgi:transcriptional regulator with XRE-family HTH domain